MQTEYNMDVSPLRTPVKPINWESLIMYERTLQDSLVFLSFLKTINMVSQYE